MLLLGDKQSSTLTRPLVALRMYGGVSGFKYSALDWSSRRAAVEAAGHQNVKLFCEK